MYLVTWIEGEEVEYRFLPSEELPEQISEDKNPIIIKFDA